MRWDENTKRVKILAIDNKNINKCGNTNNFSFNQRNSVPVLEGRQKLQRFHFINWFRMQEMGSLLLYYYIFKIFKEKIYKYVRIYKYI